MMNHTQASLTQNYQNQRQQPQSVQNALSSQNGGTYPMQTTISMNGITAPSYYAQQTYNGYVDNQARANPTLNLHKSAQIVQYPAPGGAGNFYEIYQTNPSVQHANYPVQQQQYYYSQYSGMSIYPSVPSSVQMPQSMALDSQFQGYASQPTSNFQQAYPVTVPQSQSIAPAQQTAESRQKKLLNFVDPKTGASLLQNEEKKTTSPVEGNFKFTQSSRLLVSEPTKEELEQKAGEDVKMRFRTALAGAAMENEPKKQEVVDTEVPAQSVSSKEVQPPAPASSAPPPSINVSEEQQTVTSKAASVEPATQVDMPVQNSESNPAAAPPSERPGSPALTTASGAKEQQQDEEEVEKLLMLERKANELYELKSAEIENRIYSFDVLEMIHEIVKCYKKATLSVDTDLLKRKGLDVQSELPQQMQNRSKYSNPSNAFNPGWNSNTQQIVGNRKNLYPGRHSDNKMSRKKGPFSRASFDRAPRQPPPPPMMDLRKAENAWKPKRRGEIEISEDEKKHEAIRKEIRSILNKITPTTYHELIQDFFKMDVGQEKRYQEIAIELIFDKAVEEPKFCPLYTNLCKEQVDRGNRSPGSFFHTLLQKVQATFEGDSAFDSKIKEIKEQLNEEVDDKKKADLHERLEMLKDKEKRYILGNIKFISHLYTVNLIVDNVIAFCLCKLHEMFDATKDDIYIQYGIELLELISKIYFSEEKKKQRSNDPIFKIKNLDNVQSFVNWLSTKDCKNEVSTKIRVMIMNFEDFVRAGYHKRNADKGPKKLGELHDDIKKEQETQKHERLAYEMHKKEDRYTPRQPYAGRGSLDRKNTQEKRITAATASINTGNSAPSKKTGSIRNTLDAPTKLGKQSYFAVKKTDEPSTPVPEVVTKVSIPPEPINQENWVFVGGEKKAATGPSSSQSRISSVERN